jgi:hypothetical protein
MNAYVNEAWDRGQKQLADQQARAVALNRNNCLSECTSELFEHHTNRDQAQANVDALEQQLANLAPAVVEAAALEALRSATAAGDAKAATKAAETVQRFKIGIDEASIERLTVSAKLDQCRADLASTKASLKQAETEALKARLAELDKFLAQGVSDYQKLAQQAFREYKALVAMSKKRQEFAAAVTGGERDVHYERMDAGPSELTLPTLYVPGFGYVAAVGRHGG